MDTKKKKSPARVNNGWSGRSKQTARRSAPKTPSQQQKEDLAHERSQIALEKSVARELARAARFREKDGPTMERRKTRAYKDSPAEHDGIGDDGSDVKHESEEADGALLLMQKMTKDE